LIHIKTMVECLVKLGIAGCGDISAIITAIEKLRQAGPNGRDYQTAPPGALCKAQAEHAARLKHLEIVMRELDQIAQHIANSV
jgi:hypothetical protein